MESEFKLRPESDPGYQMQQYLTRWKARRPQIEHQLQTLPERKIKAFKEHCTKLLVKDIKKDLGIIAEVYWDTIIEIVPAIEDLCK